MKKFMIRNKIKRDYYSKIEVKVRILRYIMQSSVFLFKWRVQAGWLLFNLLNKKSFTAIELRCRVTFLSHSVTRKTSVSRHVFKLSAQQGLLAGSQRLYK